jgi:hypothetical protein
MTPDPDHVRVLELSFHIIDCQPAMPYERYGEKHRKGHNRRAKEFLARIQNAGYTLTTNEGAR